jgi:hypothetical protein
VLWTLGDGFVFKVLLLLCVYYKWLRYGSSEPLVVFLESRHMVPCCELFSFHIFSFLSMPNPSPLICSHSSISFHSHLLLSIISLPCAFNPFHALFMHTKCFRSSLHTLSVLFVRFLCTLGDFDPHYMCSMYTFMHFRWYQSSSCAFYARFYAC